MTNQQNKRVIQAFNYAGLGFCRPKTYNDELLKGNKGSLESLKFWQLVHEARRRQLKRGRLFFIVQATSKEDKSHSPKQPPSNTSLPKSKQEADQPSFGSSPGDFGNGNGGRNQDSFGGHEEDNPENQNSPISFFCEASEKNIDSDLKGVLRAYKISFDSLPDDVKRAIQTGVISRSTLSYFLLQLRNPFLGWALRLFRSFRNRVLADKDFLYKVMVQEIVGNGTALIGEVMVRKKEILDEMEYVLSDMIIGLVVEATFVWLLAPANPFPTLQTTRNGHFLVNIISQLPANMFEAASPNRPYNIFQRGLSFLWSGIQYSVIGIGAGLVGTVLTYGMLQIRKQFQPHYQIRRRLPPIIANSLGWGAYMFLSANPRFQMVEGLERLCGILFVQRLDWLLKFCIFFLRFGNNLYGGIQFVQFFRALGLQSTEDLQP
ncbi:protein reticulata-related 3, chloroplastic [Galdieria sulphuraria]|nr:protein reticulata-related 3, chloroplastic [Galdieria sulphuraria]